MRLQLNVPVYQSLVIRRKTTVHPLGITAAGAFCFWFVSI